MNDVKVCDRGRYNTFITAKQMFFVFLQIVVTTVLAFLSSSERIFPLVLLPLFYSIGHIMLLGLHRYTKTPGLLMLNILYFVRYYLLPLLILCDSFRPFYISDNIQGIWLLLYEQIIGIIVLWFVLPKRFSFVEKEKKTLSMVSARSLYITTFVVVLFGLILIIRNPSILQKYNFIFSISSEKLDNVNNLDVQVSTIEAFCIQFILLLVPASLCMSLANKYKRNNNPIMYYIALVVPFLLSIAVIEGSDRGSVLLSGVAVVYMFMFLVPEKAKKTQRIAMCGFVILGGFLIAVRLFPNSSSGDGDSGLSEIIDYIQSYVSGPYNMQVVVDTADVYKDNVSLMTVLGDLFSNVPFLSGFVDPNNTCLKFFNVTYGRVGMDQVIPLIGNGVMYFGYVLAPLLNAIMIKIVVMADRAFSRSNNVFGVFAFSYAAVLIAFCHYQSLQLIMLYTTCNILPLLLVYYIVKRKNEVFLYE